MHADMSTATVDARWVLQPADLPRAPALARALSVSPVTAQLLINRGIDEPEQARRFLAPRLAELRRPDGDAPMAGFAVAVERLARALAARETVGIFGDYDVDGVTSCALLAALPRATPAAASSRASPAATPATASASTTPTRFADAGCAVVVTCDCGTSDHEALAAARARGVDVIVVDHHQVPERDPDALALINPHQPSCRFPFKGLASVGVAFYLAAALRTRLRDARLADAARSARAASISSPSAPSPIWRRSPTRTASSCTTACSACAQPPRPGLAALGRVAGLDDGVQRAADISLRLAPRLNAPGRLGDAQPALELLLADDRATPRRAPPSARRPTSSAAPCRSACSPRRMAQAEAQPDGVLVVAGAGWHAGVVGIVAAKLVDRFARPSLVIALDGDGRARPRLGAHRRRLPPAPRARRLRRSARALRRPRRRRRPHHRGAPPRRAAHAPVGRRRAPPSASAAPAADARRRRRDRARRHRRAARRGAGRLEPFGIGNPEPVLGARGVTLERTRVVGEQPPAGHAARRPARARRHRLLAAERARRRRARARRLRPRGRHLPRRPARARPPARSVAPKLSRRRR